MVEPLLRGACDAGFAGDVFYSLCSFLSSPGLGCSASWLVWTRRTVFWKFGRRLRQWHVVVGFLLFALCSFLCRPAQMLGIMASMNQKDSYAA